LKHNKQIISRKVYGTDNPISAMNRLILGMGMVYRWFFAYRIHVIAWSVYIFYEAGLTGIFVGRFGTFENYLVHYVLNISLFYAHAYLIKKVTSKNGRLKVFKILTLTLVETGIYITLLATLNHLFTSYNQPIGDNLLGITPKFLGGAVYRAIFFILFSTGYFFLLQYITEKRKATELEKEGLEKRVYHETVQKDLALAKNAYLRAQVNPHLFFNGLNFIHRRIKKTDAIAGDMVIALADMMRYAIDSNHTQELIPLKDEVVQLENLISIFKTIHNERFNLELIYDKHLLSQLIIPLLLITLLENMYKHGDLSSPDSPGKIEIYSDQKYITISSRNLSSYFTKAPSLGTGLLNLEKRLRDTYKENMVMNWHTESDRFILVIKLPINLMPFE